MVFIYVIVEYYLQSDCDKLKMFTINPRAIDHQKQATDNNKNVQHG